MSKTVDILYATQILTLFAVWILPLHSVAIGQETGERFLKEAPAMRVEYSRQVLGIQMNQKTWQNTPGNQTPKGSPSEHLQIRRNQSGTLLLSSFESSYLCRCVVKNDRYAFRLEKPTITSQWRVAQVYTDLRNEETVSFLKNNLDYFEKTEQGGVRYSGPFELFRWSLISLTDQPGFRITKTADVFNNGRKLVRIDFVCDKNENAARNSRFHYESGWLVLDPQHYWAICEYEAHFDWPGGYVRSFGHGVHEIAQTRNGVPFLKSSVIQLKNTQNGQREDFDVRTECTAEEREPSRDEFTLTAFGFPEPMGMPPVSRGGSLLWLWISLAAVGSAGLAVLYQKLKRRFQLAEAATK